MQLSKAATRLMQPSHRLQGGISQTTQALIGQCSCLLTLQQMPAHPYSSSAVFQCHSSNLPSEAKLINMSASSLLPIMALSAVLLCQVTVVTGSLHMIGSKLKSEEGLGTAAVKETVKSLTQSVICLRLLACNV